MRHARPALQLLARTLCGLACLQAIDGRTHTPPTTPSSSRHTTPDPRQACCQTTTHTLLRAVWLAASYLGRPSTPSAFRDTTRFTSGRSLTDLIYAIALDNPSLRSCFPPKPSDAILGAAPEHDSRRRFFGGSQNLPRTSEPRTPDLWNLRPTTSPETPPFVEFGVHRRG